MCECGRWSCDSCRNEMYWRSIGLRRTSQQQFARSAQLRIDRENRIAERKRPVYKNRMYADNNQPPQIAAPLNGQFAVQYGGVQGPDIVVEVQPRRRNPRIFGSEEDMEEPYIPMIERPGAREAAQQSPLYLAIHGPGGHWDKAEKARELRERNQQELLERKVIAEYNQPRYSGLRSKEVLESPERAERIRLNKEKRLKKVQRDLYSSVTYKK